jgi:hypothetical protein
METFVMKKCESTSNEKLIGKLEVTYSPRRWQQKAGLWASIGLITAGSGFILFAIFISVILYSG